MKKIELLGKTFGRLTVTGFSGIDRTRRARWDCECVCGKTKVVDSYHLRRGRIVSCGCYHSEVTSRVGLENKRHGHCSMKRMSPTYTTWIAMHVRCYDPNNKGWKYYGGRGIGVCDRWFVFDNFLQDMGERPYRKTLDRMDNDSGYKPSNCRWATRKQQAANRRKPCRTRIITAG